MTQEEYIQIYLAQQRKLQAHSLVNNSFSDHENELLDMASALANGEIIDLSNYDVDNIDQITDDILTMLKKVKNEKQLKQLLKLLEALQSVQSSDDEYSGTNDTKSQIKPVLKPADDKIDENPVIQKAKDYGAWAKQQYQQFGKDLKAKRKTKLIDTSKYDNLSRDELVALYHPSKFYSLSTKDRNALFQATVNDYLISNGAQPCAVSFMDMPITDKSIHYGLYRPQYGDLFINSRLFENIDELATNGNINFPYHILSTLIHEATHALQFQSIISQPLSKKDQLILNSMKHNQSSLSYQEYLAEADELDARNSALEYIRNSAISAQRGRENLKAYYNTQKNRELKTSKAHVQSDVQALFPDLFDSTFLTPDIAKMQRMNSSAKEMQTIVQGKYISETLQRRKRF